MRKSFILILLILFLCTSLCSCTKEDTPYVANGFAFDTFITFILYGDKDNAKETAALLINKASYLDSIWNKNLEGSDIYIINNSHGNPVSVSDETAELLKLAKMFSEDSHGAFDLTIGSVTALWDFKSDSPAIPDSSKISSALSNVNYENIHLEGNEVTLLDKDTKIDVGGIAKGLAGDILKQICVENDIPYGIINLGGNVIAINNKPDNTPFIVGVKNPERDADGNITTISISDCCVVTSGVYERCFELDNEIYHHILDTKTGYPVRNNLLSVSIVGPSSAYCDGLSTILFIKGLEEGLEYLKHYDDYEAIFITDQKEIIYSTNY